MNTPKVLRDALLRLVDHAVRNVDGKCSVCEGPWGTCVTGCEGAQALEALNKTRNMVYPEGIVTVLRRDAKLSEAAAQKVSEKVLAEVRTGLARMFEAEELAIFRRLL